MQPFPEKPILFVDNSLIEVITTCPQKAFNYVIQKRRAAAPDPALRQGGHLHAALAYRYRSEALGLSWYVDVQKRILERRYTRTPCETEEWRNLEFACDVITRYDETYPIEEFTIEKFNGFPFVERPFAIELKESFFGVRVVYIGRIDLLVRSLAGHLFVMDHKTTSMLGDGFWNDQQMSEQQRGYCWAVREVLGVEPVGYWINVLATRKPTQTGKSIEFVRRRFFTKEPEGQLDEWYSNMLKQVKTFLWQYKEGLWPMNHTHCQGKYRLCEYFRVCELPAHSREAALASSAFRVNTWTPLYK